MSARLLFIFLSCLFCGLQGLDSGLSFPFYNGLQNSRVQSSTYLVSTVVKNLVTVEVINKGNKAANHYLLAIPKAIHNKLALLQAIDGTSKKELVVKVENKVEISQEDLKSFEMELSEVVFYSVQLPTSLPADNGQTPIQLELTLAWVHMMEPLPEKIQKTGKQFMVFTVNRNYLSPYQTNKLTCKYVFSTDKFKSFPKPVASQEDKKLTYGPFTGVKPLAYIPFRFHFQFHQPVLTVTEMIRDIEISHWGNVRVEESFQMKHDGATLTGPYEVAQLDRLMNKDPSVVTQLRATLPRRAYGTYYVDRIGNISTSHFRQGPKQSYLEIKPRYPLYGGWKTDFTIGYDVPSQDLITLDAHTYVHTLNLSFGILFREPVTDLLTTKIALPEGAYDVQVDCPFEIDKEPISRRFTYLDTVLFGGRPLITFHKRNVINLHDEFYQIRYKYDHFRVYYKLILLVGGFFSFFMFIVVILRINPSLDSEQERELRIKSSQKSNTSTVVPPTASSKDPRVIIASISREDAVGSIIERLEEAKKHADKPLSDRLGKEIKNFKKAKDKEKVGKLVDSLSKLQ